MPGRVKTLGFECPAGMVYGRCVTLNDATGVVAYTAAGAVPTHITVGNAMTRNVGGTAYTIEVQNIKQLDGTETLTAAAAIALGANLEVVGVVGKVQTLSTGAQIGLKAYHAAAEDGETFAAYRAEDSIPTPVTPNDTAAIAIGLADSGSIIGCQYTDTGAVTVTIASAAIADDSFRLRVFDAAGNAGTNNITIATEGAETINEQATLVIALDSGYLDLASDGTNLFAAGAIA